MLEFLFLVEQLKNTPREGWVYRNIPNPESIADHMHRVALLALVLPSEVVDKNKCIKMAIVHDLAECIIGDITPFDNIPKEEKYQKESAAMQHLASLLSDEAGKEIVSLWQEYDAGVTLEASWVKQLDKLEAAIQCHFYQKQHKIDLSQYIKNIRSRLSAPVLIEILDNIIHASAS